MKYVEVINCTEGSLKFRPPWNQGDVLQADPGESLLAPEDYLHWCESVGLMPITKLEQVWDEVSAEASAEVEADTELVDDEDVMLPESIGVTFDSKPRKKR